MGRVLVGIGIVVLFLFGIAIAYQDYLFFYLIAKPDAGFAETAQPAPPDYAQAEAWAALPGNVYANKLPEGVAPVPVAEREADVFFVHGTSVFAPVWNADLADTDTNWRTDGFAIAQMASAFSGCCRIYAPRYRQAGLFAFVGGGADGEAALDLAYSDVEAAFARFVAQSGDRPLILVGHSQGTAHLLRLLREHVEGTALADRVVAIYALGYWLADTVYPELTAFPVCETADQTGCLVSWDTYMDGGDRSAAEPKIGFFIDGAYRARVPGKGLCINPVTWQRDGESEADAHKGGVPFGFLTPDANPDPNPYREFTLPALVSRHTGARCDAVGALIVSPEIDAHFRAAEMPGKSLHPMDGVLFWADIRANAQDRLRAFPTP